MRRDRTTNREIKPISVGRWPWNEEIISWTWRDTQAHYLEGCQVTKNRRRAVLAVLAVLAVFITRWVMA